jgi:hypothetical protein
MKRISIQVDKNMRKVILKNKRSRLITAFYKGLYYFVHMAISPDIFLRRII